MMSSVESKLTRELDIRFIDARTMVSEAKINLGHHGYAAAGDYDAILLESIRIYEARSLTTKKAMHDCKFSLDRAKSGRAGRRTTGGARSTTSGSSDSHGLIEDGSNSVGDGDTGSVSLHSRTHTKLGPLSRFHRKRTLA